MPDRTLKPGTPVKVIKDIQRTRGDGNISAGTLGIVCWADDYRGYASVQFVGRVTDMLIPISDLKITVLTTPNGV